MIAWTSPALLAVAALVSAKTDTPKQQRRCRDTLRDAMGGLQEAAANGRAARRMAPEAREIVENACRACARCEGP